MDVVHQIFAAHLMMAALLKIYKDVCQQLRETELIAAFMLMINKQIYIGNVHCHQVLKVDILISQLRIMKQDLDKEIIQMLH